ncbi:MAG: MBL fold metallo-hydrolase [Actinomycetota bacterium]|nr:MBL fold metallo-hydrolase [Actinomycetota bacterium]MDA3013453.1 MBL fold metallo-hydrolase [Actinomycetota bacterium]
MQTVKRFTSFTTSNCYVVTPDNSGVCFLIDLPPDLDETLSFIKSNNLAIAGAFITHGHYDHALGMKEINKNIYMNLDDEFLARNPQEQIGQLLNGISLNKYDGEINDVFSHNFDFLKVHSNPGHTKGSVSFEFNNLGIVFTGDFVFKDSIGRTDLFSGDIFEMKESINNIFLKFNKNYDVFPGHGDYESVQNILLNNYVLKEYIND